MEAKELIAKIESGDYNDTILDIYVDEGKVEYQRQRYMYAINQYISAFGNDDVEIYSAPGRSEVGGNHTDHQHGEVLAASINLDAIAIVKPLDKAVVKIISKGYDMITVNLDNIGLMENEKETTLYDFDGFIKNVTSIIDASVKSAFERGYRVIIPKGTNSTFDNDYMDGETTYKYYNEMMWPKRFADCISLEEAIEMLYSFN